MCTCVPGSAPAVGLVSWTGYSLSCGANLMAAWPGHGGVEVSEECLSDSWGGGSGGGLGGGAF